MPMPSYEAVWTIENVSASVAKHYPQSLARCASVTSPDEPSKRHFMFQHSPSKDETKIKLFCFPHAGAGPSAYRGWAQALDPFIELSVIPLPGREAQFRQPPYRSLPDLVHDVSDAILNCLAAGQRFAFFGNSFGAFAAFEVALSIRSKSGLEPSHLFMCAAAAPHLPRSGTSFSSLSDSKLIDEVSRRYGGIPEAIRNDKEYLAAILPVLRADLTMLDDYLRQLSKPFACSLTAFGGRFDSTISIESLSAWKEHITGEFSCFMFDQPHLFLQSERESLTFHISKSLAGEFPSNQSIRNNS